mmetsp:Transcript_53518/g.142213  ORF Transcript_53518/g.142213 Transcript_53518/m.142213 type:complete len:557 (-) Transcript_53518:208-1878(-)
MTTTILFEPGGGSTAQVFDSVSTALGKRLTRSDGKKLPVVAGARSRGAPLDWDDFRSLCLDVGPSGAAGPRMPPKDNMRRPLLEPVPQTKSPRRTREPKLKPITDLQYLGCIPHPPAPRPARVAPRRVRLGQAGIFSALPDDLRLVCLSYVTPAELAVLSSVSSSQRCVGIQAAHACEGADDFMTLLRARGCGSSPLRAAHAAFCVRQASAQSGRRVLAAGMRHSVAVRRGVPWTFGDGRRGQLGRDAEDPTPLPVRLHTRVRSVACGVEHTLCVCDDGSAWAWGRNGNGQCAQPPGDDDVATPAQVQGIGGRVDSVACGADHSVFCAGGVVWGCGRGLEGQLGGDRMLLERSLGPIALPLVSNEAASQAVCGADHTIVLTTLGGALAIGEGSRGQLGVKASRPQVAVRVPCRPGVAAWVKAACGATYTVLVSDLGSSYIAGTVDPSKDGDGSLRHIPATGSSTIVDVHGGFKTAFFLTRSGWVWALHANGWEQQSDLRSIHVSAISAGGAHALVLGGPCRDVWSFGDGTDGQLGRQGSAEEPAAVVKRLQLAPRG